MTVERSRGVAMLREVRGMQRKTRGALLRTTAHAACQHTARWLFARGTRRAPRARA